MLVAKVRGVAKAISVQIATTYVLQTFLNCDLLLGGCQMSFKVDTFFRGIN